APLLGRFATAPAFRLLAEATVSYRDLEFLTTIDGAGAPDSWGETRLKVRGVIDGLCQDSRGDWHLLAYMLNPEPNTTLDQEWTFREPGLALAARAVYQQMGTWPESATLYSFAEGESVRRPGSSLKRPELLARVAAVLNEVLGQPLADSRP